ncbi:hypothetical protein [Aureimonas sp. AU20]|uniref:hypothetical protein n=1 Tax=Aureimonas sp. AU20 TaxID=1349819 RepID=UPI0007216E4C|nr:hypothetical protein [Aureimonas sp. AU20]ALN75843.1 hypothetical protein M673_24110 [Aureimonas sp. AU20]
MSYSLKEAEDRIRKGAAARGMDPATAVRVARSEGLAPGVYQSALGRNGRREPSYGPFQLLVGGEGTGYGRGLGNAFMQQTGLDPRDPSTVPQQIDFALDQAKAGGWAPWFGAAKVGIGKWDGIRQNPRQADDTENVASSTNDTDFSQELPMPGSRATPGGLGGLGGIPVEPEPEGVTGFLGSQGFGDWLSAMGTSLMESPSNNPLAGFSDALASRQTLRQRQEAIENDRAGKANDRRAMEMALRNAGVPADQARALSGNASAANLAIQQLERDRVATRSNLTAERLRDRHPDLAAAIDDGSMLGVDAAKEAYRRDEDARKPPSLQEIYTEDGGSQKGYFRDGEWHPVGGAKKPSQGANGGGAPSGFRYTDETRTTLEPIPGGPGEQIGGENAGRIGIAQSFLDDLPSIRQEVQQGGVTGLYDAMVGKAGFGQQGRLYARIESGADALQRMLSGAGMPESEAAAYARRYMPSPSDTSDIVDQKLGQLERELGSQMNIVMRGRGGRPGASTAPARLPTGTAASGVKWSVE